MIFHKSKAQAYRFKAGGDLLGIIRRVRSQSTAKCNFNTGNGQRFCYINETARRCALLVRGEAESQNSEKGNGMSKQLASILWEGRKL